MKPKLLDRPNRCEVLVDVVRLYYVETNLFVIGAIHVFFAVAAADHDYRNTFEVLILFHGLQNIMPTHFREVEIQKYDGGSRCVRILPLTAQEGKSFFAVCDHMRTVQDSRIPQSFQRETRVAGVVLYKENLNRLAFHSVLTSSPL